MLAQLKTVVLIKVVIKLAFVRLLDNLELPRRPASWSRLFTADVEMCFAGTI
jgi:hypothetical protein